jgi:hypothetical protein
MGSGLFLRERESGGRAGAVGEKEVRYGPPPAFFETETLEMSGEEVQQTLSANMGAGGGELEPMSPSAEDVFVNLDAFDIPDHLILADLGDDFPPNHPHPPKPTLVDINPEWAYAEVRLEEGSFERLSLSQDFPSRLFTQHSPSHSDLSSLFQGGTKILVVGEFPSRSGEYTVTFGDLAVPAAYLQLGVLKCFCPRKSEREWE